jgi:hypothetical protein
MRYKDDSDAIPRLRVKEGAQQSTLAERVTKLEHKVAEFSALLNGITQQLVDVSSSVHDLTRLPGVYEHGEHDTTRLPGVYEHGEHDTTRLPGVYEHGRADDEKPVEFFGPTPPRRRKKSTYIDADTGLPPAPERRLGDDIIIADRDL